MTHPSNVPAEAQWISYKKMWALGSNNEKGNRHGKWRWWKVGNSTSDAYLLIDENYNDGQVDGSYTRYYLTGQPAIEATYLNGRMHGKVTYFLSDTESLPDKPRLNYGNVVRKMEVYYWNGIVKYCFLYDKKGNLVDEFGRPRPASVPENAHWNPGKNQWESAWEVATYDVGDIEGLCQRWSGETGKLSFEANFVGGQIEGVAKAYYKNGELASETEYKNGNPVSPHFWYRCSKEELSIGFNSDEGKNIWKKAVYYKEGERLDTADFQYFLKDGTPCNKKGLQTLNIKLKDLFDIDPNDFLQKSFAEYLRRWLGDKFQPISDARKTQRRQQFQHFYGFALPDEVALYFDIVESANCPELFGNLHTAIHLLDTLEQWEKEGKNTVEMATLAMQRTYPFDFWIDWILGGISLDALVTDRNAYASFSFLYDVNSSKPGSIYCWSHTDYSGYYGSNMDGICASNLSTFLFFNCLMHANTKLGVIDDKEGAELIKKVASSIKFSYHFYNAFMSDKPHSWKLSASLQQTRLFSVFSETRWVWEALRAAVDLPMTISYTVGYGRATNALASITNEVKGGAALPFARSMQWIFSALLANTPGITDAIAHCRSSPALLLRHAADLAQQFTEGRKLLGKVFVPNIREKIM